MQTILLIEDNPAICMGLEYLLKQEGYHFLEAKSRKIAEQIMSSEHLDLILLDVSLPDGDGFSLCEQIRQNDLAPVIFLTARDEEQDVVKGFELGAQDYVCKPFRNRELVMRIRNVLKRSKADQYLECQKVRMDTEAGKVYADGVQVTLTKLEYRILLIFFSNPGRLFTREEILGRIWDMAGNFVNDNTLTVYIKRIREKIGDKEGHVIETVRGMGYRLGK